VFEHRIDNIVGIAYAMDMLDYVEQVELLQRLTVGRIAHRPAYFVPDSMSVWNLLREFRIRKVHMAIVLNEYGGTVGVCVQFQVHFYSDSAPFCARLVHHVMMWFFPF
jgi:CBS domain containing-hemolysin-like protein